MFGTVEMCLFLYQKSKNMRMPYPRSSLKNLAPASLLASCFLLVLVGDCAYIAKKYLSHHVSSVCQSHPPLLASRHHSHDTSTSSLQTDESRRRRRCLTTASLAACCFIIEGHRSLVIPAKREKGTETYTNRDDGRKAYSCCVSCCYIMRGIRRSLATTDNIVTLPAIVLFFIGRFVFTHGGPNFGQV